MKKIFTTKISLQSSNPTFSYPIIRLPRELKELAGRIANIYQTEINGVHGFFVAPQLDKLDKCRECIDKSNPAPKCGLIDQSIQENRRPRARFEPASWPPQGRCLYSPCKCAIKRLLISVAEQGKSGTLAFPGFITT
jgi:hypothetical protein